MNKSPDLTNNKENSFISLGNNLNSNLILNHNNTNNSESKFYKALKKHNSKINNNNILYSSNNNSIHTNISNNNSSNYSSDAKIMNRIVLEAEKYIRQNHNAISSRQSQKISRNVNSDASVEKHNQIENTYFLPNYSFNTSNYNMNQINKNSNCYNNSIDNNYYISSNHPDMGLNNYNSTSNNTIKNGYFTNKLYEAGKFSDKSLKKRLNLFENKNPIYRAASDNNMSNNKNNGASRKSDSFNTIKVKSLSKREDEDISLHKAVTDQIEKEKDINSNSLADSSTNENHNKNNNLNTIIHNNNIYINNYNFNIEKSPSEVGQALPGSAISGILNSAIFSNLVSLNSHYKTNNSINGSISNSNKKFNKNMKISNNSSTENLMQQCSLNSNPNNLNLNSSSNKPKNFFKKYAVKSLAGRTEAGATKVNQDNYLLMENILNCEDYSIYGVFDGHGKILFVFYISLLIFLILFKKNKRR